jgi:hypothetical protein
VAAACRGNDPNQDAQDERYRQKPWRSDDVDLRFDRITFENRARLFSARKRSPPSGY